MDNDAAVKINTRNIVSLAEAMKLLRQEDTIIREQMANAENTIAGMRGEIEALRGLIMASMQRNIGPTEG